MIPGIAYLAMYAFGIVFGPTLVRHITNVRGGNRTEDYT